MPSTCDSCTGASRRLCPLGRLGRPGEAGRGGGGRGCARACQRVPGVIYDVRPMSLSAGLLTADCGQRLDRQAGLPPGPPGPLPNQRAVLSGLSWGLAPPPQSHLEFSVSLHLSVTHSLSLFLSFCLSWFLRPYTPSVSVPPCSGSPSLDPLHFLGCPSLLSLSLYLSLLASIAQSLSLSLQLFLISVSLFLPLPPALSASHPFGPGLSPPPVPFHSHLAQATGIGFLEGMWRRSPFLPLPPISLGAQLGCSAGLGRGEDRVP